ncbi:MAG: hypothetical protein QXH30_01615 [Candidatus Bilamarchaeaceae archaeon]
MKTSKAFIFSLDSFVAFILTVAALYSLLFFSTVPSAYYSSLMQANYLAKDTLLTLATTACTEVPDCEGMTYLDYILLELENGLTDQAHGGEPAREYIGRATYSPQGSALIPEQFGYKIEVMRPDGTWSEESDLSLLSEEPHAYYDTRLDELSVNKKEYNKLKASAHILFFGYSEGDEPEVPYSYITCSGTHNICAIPASHYDFGEANMEVIRLTVYT